MWPIASTQTFIDHFEGNGLVQAECGGLNAGFGSDVTEICQYDMVSYTDMSSGDIVSWAWTFEGGDPATSTEQNPVVTYNEVGTFDVTLEISDGTDVTSVTFEDYITVETSPPAMLSPFDDVSISTPPFELTGGSPAGGVYTGLGVTDGWFYPEDAGLGEHMITYTYTSATTGCDNFDEQSILVVEIIGIDEVNNNNIQLYPNPTQGKFELKINHSGNVSVKIYNILGEYVYELNTNSSGLVHETIDLSNLEGGIYFVSVNTDENTSVSKLKLVN